MVSSGFKLVQPHQAGGFVRAVHGAARVAAAHDAAHVALELPAVRVRRRGAGIRRRLHRIV
jgi:hypothetical protein